MQDDDEYEELARWMGVLAAEYARTHDEKIKEAIITLSLHLAELRSRRTS